MDTAWTYEITRDKLATLQIELEWVLQRQNERFSKAMPAQRISLGTRRLVLLCAALVVAVTSLVAMRDEHGHLGVWPTTSLVIAAFATLMAIFLPRLRAWSKRTAGAMLTRRATRILRPVIRKAPYTIEYKLAGEELIADVAALALHRVLALAAPKLVLATPGLVVALRRTHSLHPLRVIYAAGGDRDALLAAFRARGVPCEELAGPVDGYVAPVPEARAR